MLIKNELELYNKIKNNQKQLEKKQNEWKQKIKEKINKYYNNNDNKKKYIIKKIFKKNNENDYWINYEYIEYTQNNVNIYQIKPIKDSSNLSLLNLEIFGKEDEIEDYFQKEKMERKDLLFIRILINLS